MTGPARWTVGASTRFPPLQTIPTGDRHARRKNTRTLRNPPRTPSPNGIRRPISRRPDALAVSTALFAVLAAFASLNAGDSASEALYRANQAVLQQTQAVDTWSQFQGWQESRNRISR